MIFCPPCGQFLLQKEYTNFIFIAQVRGVVAMIHTISTFVFAHTRSN